MTGAGVSVKVIPGYQSWTIEQREKLLELAGAGEFTGQTVWARGLAGGAVYVSDRATPREAGVTSAFILERDGEDSRVSIPARPPGWRPPGETLKPSTGGS